MKFAALKHRYEVRIRRTQAAAKASHPRVVMLPALTVLHCANAPALNVRSLKYAIAILSIALANRSFADQINKNANVQCGAYKDGNPCEAHARATRERFASTLEALGCICRALLALGEDSCCAPAKRSSLQRKRSPRILAPSHSSASDSCCANRAVIGLRKSRLGSRKNSCATAQSDFSNLNLSADACCAEKTPQAILGKTEDDSINIAGASDIEMALTGKEHVRLNISGMTCTGCETKLRRTLASLKSVMNLKTSLVLARAEFDLDLSTLSVAQVITYLERTTEFKCEKINNQGSKVDLMVPGKAADFMKKEWPMGVLEMTAVDKKTIRVTFDDRITGSRDLVEKGWNEPVKLAPFQADPNLLAGSQHVRNVGYRTLLSILLTIPVLIIAWAPLPEREITYASVSLGLATMVQFGIAGNFYPNALKSLIFSRMIEMDLLIVLGTSAAYIFSVVSFGFLISHQPLPAGQFFETSTLLVTLIMIGRYVAAVARQKAVESISAYSLQTLKAVLVDANGSTDEIDCRLLQYGDIFKVVPHARVPTDGTIISGSSEVDESMLTGEINPVEKRVKSIIIAGSINGSGALVARLTRLPRDNTISIIADMVDQAKLSKPRIQDTANRVASYFVPVVIIISIITFCTWTGIGVSIRKQSGSEAAMHAITYAITVLIVSCPCAIGLAVPMVVVIASGIAAERGVIFKSAESIELSYKASHVVFDKTGTLTQGKLSVAVEEYLGCNTDVIKSQLLGLVSSVKHPVSNAVSAHLQAKGVSADMETELRVLPGQGIESTSANGTLRAGNPRWLNLSSDPYIESLSSQGYTIFCFTIDNALAAVFGLKDSLRPDTLSTVQKLSQAKISVHVVSGDEDGAVRLVASQLSIADANIRSQASPADKQAYIQSLLVPPEPDPTRSLFHKKTKELVVIFCGDGTNDAVALAQATIGVHINEGSDVAQSAADVVLIKPSLIGILDMISISKISFRRIAFNFGWSFVYNLFAILLAAGAFVNARISPEFAGLGELVSVLPVIFAAVLLRWSKINV